MKKTYLCGGAVRDKLMKRNCEDYDWVVVGSTEQQMLDMGFNKVGADFPVFLHPDSGSEYALARKEKKTGTGYLGFESDFGSDVTIFDDLIRRDITINAMAIGPIEGDCELIDPYNGEQDIKDKILRHTSNAFSEDPVRVLRLARFRARFGTEWTVAPETATLVSQMAKSGTLNELNSERVWKELSRALMEPHPRLFFDTLLETDALHVVFPEVYRLKTALESFRWHPEGDAMEHSLLVLTAAARAGFDLETRMAALVHDFGKGLTPRDKLPKHFGHDVKGVPVVEYFCNRLSVPSKMRQRLMAVTKFHMNMHRLDQLNPKTYVKMFTEMGAFNDPVVVNLLHRLGQVDERGRLGSQDANVDHLVKVVNVFNAVRAVKFADVFPDGETNVNRIKDGMFRARVQAVKSA